MKALWAALLVFTVCAAAIAVPPRPFFGLNLNANFPQAEFSGKDIIYNQGGAKTGFGGELNVGLDWPEIQVYLGYQEGLHAAEGESIGIVGYGPYRETLKVSANGHWKLKRVVIGGRIPLSKARVAPILGAAVTIGRTSFDPTVTFDNQTVEISSQSASSTGMQIEGGVRVRINDKATLLALVQYQKFDADFQIDLAESGTYGGSYDPSFSISYIGLRLGATYKL